MSAGFRFLMIVEDPRIARFVSRNGVDTLFVDLEHKGKAERQNADTWKSRQCPQDITSIREAAPDAELLVRVNPIDEDTQAEVEDALARGADCLMLPMFTTADEVMRFADIVGGRVPVVPLFETASSLRALPQLLARLPLKRAHIGLNDLHLDLGMRFMFEPLAEGYLEEPCAALRDHAVSFGIGGVARAGEGILDPALLVGEHVRLGSSWAILSRTFHRRAQTLEELVASTDFQGETDALRELYRHFIRADAATLERNREKAVDRIRDVLNLVQERS